MRAIIPGLLAIVFSVGPLMHSALNFFIFVVILSTLILVHEFGHFLMAKLAGVRVEVFSLGLGGKIFSWKRRDTDYCVSSIPLGGYVKMAGDSLEDFSGKKDEYLAQPVFKRFLIIFCGPLLNYLLGIFFFCLLFFVGYPTMTSKVGGLLEGFGAQEMGIKEGDRIVSVDGKNVSLWEELIEIIHKKKDAEIARLVVQRDGSEFPVEVRVKAQEVDDQLGAKSSIGLLGIKPSDELVIIRHGLPESLYLGISKAWGVTALTYKSLWRIVTGKMSFRDSVTGLPGMYKLTSTATSQGIIAVLYFFAVLSISLAIFNLLPIPVLDGGHIFFLLLEKIRGKALGIKAERLITKVGLGIIIFLAVFVNFNDIVKHYGDKLQKFFIK